MVSLYRWVLGVTFIQRDAIETIEGDERLNVIAGIFAFFFALCETFIVMFHISNSQFGKNFAVIVPDISWAYFSVLAFSLIFVGLSLGILLALIIISTIGTLIGGKISFWELFRIFGFVSPAFITISAVSIVIPLTSFLGGVYILVAVSYTLLLSAYCITRAMDSGWVGAVAAVAFSVFFVVAAYLFLGIGVFILAILSEIDFKDALAEFVRILGPFGLASVMAAQAIIAPIPAAFFLMFAGDSFSLQYGKELGIIVAIVAGTIGMTVGAWLAYLIGEKGGRPIVEKLMGKKPAQQAENWFEKYGTWAVMISRLIPFAPADPVSYIAGISRMSWLKFTIAIIITSLIGTAVYVIAGDQFSQLMEKYSIITDIFNLVIVAFILMSLALLARIGYAEWKKLFLTRTSVPIAFTPSPNSTPGEEIVSSLCSECRNPILEKEIVFLCPNCDAPYHMEHIRELPQDPFSEKPLCKICENQIHITDAKE